MVVLGTDEAELLVADELIVVVDVEACCCKEYNATTGSAGTANDSVHEAVSVVNGLTGAHVSFDSMYGAIVFAFIAQL